MSALLPLVPHWQPDFSTFVAQILEQAAQTEKIGLGEEYLSYVSHEA